MKTHVWWTKVSTLGIAAAFLVSLLAPAAVWAQDKNTATKVNINTATVTELQALPRIGAQVARRIVDFREKNGKFKKIEELMKVKGIGEKTFMQLKDMVTVGSESG
jgi:competence protein ComEA